jgi:hypothetical protein
MMCTRTIATGAGTVSPVLGSAGRLSAVAEADALKISTQDRTHANKPRNEHTNADTKAHTKADTSTDQPTNQPATHTRNHGHGPTPPVTHALSATPRTHHKAVDDGA